MPGGAPGGYILPGRAALLIGSDNAKIKGFQGCTVVGCDVRVVPLLRFATRVAGMGVAASAGAVIHVTVLSYLDACDRATSFRRSWMLPC